MKNSVTKSKNLIIDQETLWEKKGKHFFFTEKALQSLSKFYERGYCLHLLKNPSLKNSEEIFIWGKKFLEKEKIFFSSILSLSTIKKFFKKKTTINESITLLVLAQKKISFLSQNLDFLLPVLKDIEPPYSHPFFFSLKNSSSGLCLSVSDFRKVRSWSDFVNKIFYPIRQAQVHRKTIETDIKIKLILDGKGRSKIRSGLGFFDHMLTNFSKHSKIDLVITLKGDLEVDEHHTIEDTALALGECLKKALGDKKGLYRYGFILPMDESEAACSIDFSGRSHLEWECVPFKREYVGDFPTEMLQHFYNSFCLAAGLNMNMKITGKNEHHIIESSFKSLAKCIKQAIQVDGCDIPSSKGVL